MSDADGLGIASPRNMCAWAGPSLAWYSPLDIEAFVVNERSRFGEFGSSAQPQSCRAGLAQCWTTDTDLVGGNMSPSVAANAVR